MTITYHSKGITSLVIKDVRSKLAATVEGNGADDALKGMIVDLVTAYLTPFPDNPPIEVNVNVITSTEANQMLPVQMQIFITQMRDFLGSP